MTWELAWLAIAIVGLMELAWLALELGAWIKEMSDE